MRKINWQKFKSSSINHVAKIEELRIISYHIKTGKIYDIYFHPPSKNVDVAFWAEFDTIGDNFSNLGWTPMGLAFNHDTYCLGWKDHRLSIGTEHRYLFRWKLWLTTADRDYLFNSLGFH